MGYTAWSAGAFSPIDYNLTMTPRGSAGNFTDQEIVTRCVVGTRNGVNSTGSGQNGGSPGFSVESGSGALRAVSSVMLSAAAAVALIAVLA